MKRITCFIVLFTVLCFAKNATAQNTNFYESSCVDNNVNAIVRSAYNGTHVVMCHPHNAGEEFTLYDLGSFARKFFLPPGMIVTDFCVLDDNVFFCGTHNGQALFGYFPLSIFPNSAGAVYLTTFPSPEIFTKIEAFNNPISGLPTAAVLGWSLGGSGSIVSSEAYLITVNGINISYFHSIALTGAYVHSVIDVTVTDSYVVTAGLHSSNDIILTYVDKAFMNTAIYYRFTESDYNSGFVIEALNEDNVAVAGTVVDIPNNIFSNRIYTFHRDPILGTVTNINTQDIPLQVKSSPSDLLFLEGDTSLVMLEETFFMNQNRYVTMYIDPYNYSYSYPSVVSYDDCLYNNLDRVSPTKFLAGGKSTNDAYNLFIRNKPSPNVDSCRNFGEQKVFHGPEFNLNKYPNVPLNEAESILLKYVVQVYDIAVSPACHD